MKRISSLLCLALAVIPVVIVAYLYYQTPCRVALSWDPASHALDGLNLYNNLKTFSPFSFWMNLTFMTHWPPLPPLLMIPFYFLFGPSADTAVLLTFLSLLIVCVVPVFFLFQVIFKDKVIAPLVSYLIFIILLLSTPLFLQFSGMVMYEIPGAALSILAAVLYWIALDKRQRGDKESIRYYTFTALFTLGLLLTKWNFGLQFLLNLLLVEFLLSPKKYWSDATRTYVSPLLTFTDLPLLNLTILILLAVLSVIGWTGGGVYHVLGQKISITRVDNSVYLLAVLIIIKAVWIYRRKKVTFDRLLPWHSQLLKFCFIPYLSWMLYPFPNRFGALAYHLKFGYRPGYGRLSWENTKFYFSQLPGNVFSSLLPVLFLATCLLVLLVTLIKNKRWGMRAVFGYAFICWFSSTYFTMNKDARFLLHFLPVYFLLAAVTVGEIAQLRKGWVLIALPFLYAYFQWTEVQRFLSNPLIMTTQCYGNEKTVETLDREIVSRIVTDNGKGDRAFTAVGLTDMPSLSPLLIWELNRAHPEFSSWPKPKIADYGYGMSEDDYVLKNLNQGKINWVVVFRKVDGNNAPSLNRVVEKIESEKKYNERHEFSLIEIGFLGTLYGFFPP